MDLIFASSNQHKLKEIIPLLPEHIHLKSLLDIGIHEDIPETGNTIEENAILKAQYVYSRTKLNCFSEDTGLEVASLKGAPGVHTARYAGEERDPNNNMNLLLQQLEGKLDRRARFKTVIALFYKGKLELFEGVINGAIAQEKIGLGGFGYDPIFIPEGFEDTFGILDGSIKQQLSHRSRAMNKLLEYLKSVGCF
jgi:XTP/dITP diphosphohydrolase